MATMAAHSWAGRVLARATALLYGVGGAVTGLLAANASGTDPARAATLGTIAVGALVLGSLLASAGTRLPAPAMSLALFMAALVLAAGTFITDEPTVAVATSSLTALVVIDAVVFFTPAVAWTHVGLATGLQAVALTLGPGVPTLVTAGLVLSWCGIAVAIGLLARQASSARVDSLTGLLNRRGWDTALDEAIERAQRRGENLSVALIDVDHFKAVNDLHGHAEGDALLATIAATWRAHVDESVVLARRGGDEFAALMPGRDVYQALEQAEAMRRASAAPVSCGVGQHVPGEPAGHLLRRTDAALYAAKAAGRGRTVASANPDVGLVRDLADAIEHGQIHVALQPVVELDTGYSRGIEALARWHHPTLGDIEPDQFIPIAEDGGLITALGAAVLRQACADAHALSRTWDREMILGVNVSGRELVSPGYAEELLRVLEEVRWPPERLVLEVTESLVDASSTEAGDALARLRSAGIAIAIDDFGTGWSSLSRLDELPVDWLKLDRSFLTSLTTSARRRAIVRALIRLCDELGILVLAEGVESREQEDLLRGLGCRFAQGHLYGAASLLVDLPAPPTMRADQPPGA